MVPTLHMSSSLLHSCEMPSPDVKLVATFLTAVHTCSASIQCKRHVRLLFVFVLFFYITTSASVGVRRLMQTDSAPFAVQANERLRYIRANTPFSCICIHPP